MTTGGLVQQFVEALDAKAKADVAVEDASKKLLEQPFVDLKVPALSSKLDDILTLSGFAQEHAQEFQYLNTGLATFSDLEACTDEAGFEDPTK